MLTILGVDKKKKTLQNFTSKQLSTLKRARYSLWVDVHDATESELLLLQKVFKLHPLTVEDFTNDHSRPKIENYKFYTFIALQAIVPDEKSERLREVDFAIGKDYIISNHLSKFPSFEEIQKSVRTRKLLNQGVDYVLHALIDKKVDDYIPIVERIDSAIDRLEDSVYHAGGDNANKLNRIYKLKQRVVNLRKGVGPQREIIRQLSQNQTPFIREEVAFYFRDVYDHIIRVNDMLEYSRELVSDTFEANLAFSSNRLNEVMRILTVITTIMMPLTLITGIYGMNFAHMPELGWTYGFYFTIGLMFFVAAIMVTFFYKKGWLSSQDLG